MRTLLLATTLAIGLLASASPVEGRADVCTSATSATCPGLSCVDANGDRSFSNAECVGREDVDPCAFQSDCCGGPLGGGFWCPEDSVAEVGEIDLRWLNGCPGPWGHDERTRVGSVTIVRYECDGGDV